VYVKLGHFGQALAKAIQLIKKIKLAKIKMIVDVGHGKQLPHFLIPA
jgi:hypothetical protein